MATFYGESATTFSAETTVAVYGLLQKKAQKILNQPEKPLPFTSPDGLTLKHACDEVLRFLDHNPDYPLPYTEILSALFDLPYKLSDEERWIVLATLINAGCVDTSVFINEKRLKPKNN